MLNNTKQRTKNTAAFNTTIFVLFGHAAARSCLALCDCKQPLAYSRCNLSPPNNLFVKAKPVNFLQGAINKDWFETGNQRLRFSMHRSKHVFYHEIKQRLKPWINVIEPKFILLSFIVFYEQITRIIITCCRLKSTVAYALIGSPGRSRWPSPERQTTSYINSEEESPIDTPPECLSDTENHPELSHHEQQQNSHSEVLFHRPNPKLDDNASREFKAILKDFKSSSSNGAANNSLNSITDPAEYFQKARRLDKPQW